MADQERFMKEVFAKVENAVGSLSILKREQVLEVGDEAEATTWDVELQLNQESPCPRKEVPATRKCIFLAACHCSKGCWW